MSGSIAPLFQHLKLGECGPRGGPQCFKADAKERLTITFKSKAGSKHFL
jgi:hypothetical protein